MSKTKDLDKQAAIKTGRKPDLIRRKKFAVLYASTGKIKESAIEAGFSPTTARSHAAKLLNDPQVAQWVEDEMLMRLERLRIEPDRVLAEAAALAFVDPAELFEWGPGGVSIKPSSELSPAARAAVKEITETQTETSTKVTIKLHDKKPMLEILGRYLDLWQAKQDSLLVVNFTPAVEREPQKINNQDTAP